MRHAYNEFCNVQPGKYTLVCLGDDALLVRPGITVEKSANSAYDHASKAADIGFIPPTNTEKFSADDVFYCTTAAQYTDPDTTDNYFFYGEKKLKTSYPYPMPANFELERYSNSRRNLWYTFVCTATGDITVKVYPKTAGDESAVYKIRIYSSDEKCFSSYAQAIKAGKIDSMQKQGLVKVVENMYYNNEQNYTNTLTFQKKGCDSTRYYIVVDWSNYSLKPLNNLLSVGVKYNNVRFDGQDADYCKNAQTLELNTPGEKKIGTLINCHTRGESYGQDGSNMACLVNDGQKYKTTWFRFKYSGSQKVDLSFKLEENTTAHFSQIHYRVLYGTCDAMTPGPCVENALSYFKLDCMGPGDYYIQVVSPEDATGTISLFAKAEISTYPICKPIDLLKPLANFSYTGGCNNSPVQFINLSSAGEDITYAWKFGNNTNSTNKNPIVQYKPKNFADTFWVTLRVTNNENKKYEEIEIPVIIFRDPVTLNFTRKNIYANCGEKVQLEVKSNYAYATFEWEPKENLDNPYSATPLFTTQNADASFGVIMRAENCILRDTVHIYMRIKRRYRFMRWRNRHSYGACRL
ncbi:MAG: PKD domain-containing protein [Sphingobacteriales bacterium]|nr:MAG: PKD domain-containing protein [Sphingobacteriales bacterium]